MQMLFPRSRTTSPVRAFGAFLAVFLVLYVSALTIAERRVRQEEPESAFQWLEAYDGSSVDWLVVGASHALPLEFGDIPERLLAETRQSMLILAEVGAGPAYMSLVLDRALQGLDVAQVLYIADSFAFASRDWNEERISDRKLLARIPLDIATVRLLAQRAVKGELPMAALADYVSGFSKLNPVERFPVEGWRGAADFDNAYRPSRHAVAARMAFLYPDGAPEADIVAGYLGKFGEMLDRARAAGAMVTVLKPPVPEGFAKALPKESEFNAALRSLLEAKDIPFFDFSELVPENMHYFDTDHLNRQGVDLFYERALKQVLGVHP